MFRTNLLDELMTIQRNFDSFFKPRYDGGVETKEAVWNPAFECYSTKNEMVVRVFLPGVAQNAVSVSLTDNVLVVQGERSVPKDIHLLHSEVAYGKFERRIALPSEMLTDNDKCTAKFENGILEISVPVVAQYMQTRQIPIQTNEAKQQLA